MITKEEFIKSYREKSGGIPDKDMEKLEAIPCDCGDELCRGWQMRVKK
jgi:hypothetical protein